MRVISGSKRGGAAAVSVALTLVMLLVVALLPVLQSNTAEAQPDIGGGFYSQEAPWQFGPDPKYNDGSHVAWGGPGDYLSGNYYIDTNIHEPNLGPDATDPYVLIQGFPSEVSLAGVNGADAIIPQFSGGDIAVRCVNPDLAGIWCTIPGDSYVITFTWTLTAIDGPCYRKAHWGFPQGDYIADCPRQTFTETATRTVHKGWPGTTTTVPDQAPVALFVVSQSETDRFSFDFENRSSDFEDDPEDLSYEWDFDDGKTSTERNPTHRYERAGTYTVLLKVTDSDGHYETYSSEVVIAAGLTVNSTGDQSAENPEEQGCDTGDKVGDDPECTLRAAIETAESQGGGEISFDIDGGGMPSIAAASPLPTVSTSVTIDGTTQDGGFVGVTGGGDALLTLSGGTSRVTGLVIDQATDAVTVTGGSDHVIEGNRFGTDAAGTAEGDLAVGVVATGSSGLVVRDNVMVASSGVQVGPEATGVQIVENSVGVNKAGTASLGEMKGAVLVIGPDVEVRDNVLRGETVGVELSGATATGAKIEGNTVGLNKAGTAALPDMGYGIRVDGAPGVKISANKVSSPVWGAILVSGTVQIESGDDDTLNPNMSPGAVTAALTFRSRAETTTP